MLRSAIAESSHRAALERSGFFSTVGRWTPAIHINNNRVWCARTSWTEFIGAYKGLSQPDSRTKGHLVNARQLKRLPEVLLFEFASSGVCGNTLHVQVDSSGHWLWRGHGELFLALREHVRCATTLNIQHEA